jgi:hypothetical protein
MLTVKEKPSVLPKAVKQNIAIQLSHITFFSTVLLGEKLVKNF